MPISEDDYQAVVQFVHREASISLPDGKEYLVEGRLSPLVTRFGYSTLSELINALRRNADDELRKACLDALTTNETSFFRDVHPFEVLRTEIVPNLLEKNARERTLTIWFGACSSGQEPYSMAILLREHFPQLVTWTINMIAIDISQTMIGRCKEGRYSSLEVSRGLSNALRDKYFTPDGDDWIVNHEVRSMVDFKVRNLLDPWPPTPPIDIAFLRNVLIYFDMPTKRQVLQTLKPQMNSGGVMLLGGPETTLNIDNEFGRHVSGRTVYFTINN